MEETKFDYNAIVRIKENAPSEFRPNNHGWICSIINIQNEEQANFFGFPINTTFYTVEYEDGSSEGIPEEFLELHNNE
jgi:hypothetical protein